jgi:hypothetical protein
LRAGVEYLLPIFNGAIGLDDTEVVRATLFHPGKLTKPYHSINVDANLRFPAVLSLAPLLLRSSPN